MASDSPRRDLGECFRRANTYTTEVRVTVRPGLLNTVTVSLARLVVVGMVLRLRPVTLARRHAWYVHVESVGEWNKRSRRRTKSLGNCRSSTSRDVMEGSLVL